jgi:DNA helicase II / ATP-dependent DNA helicase PcrA
MQNHLELNKKDYQIDYEHILNAAQLEAVMFNKGSLLVIAGAGSGKTRTLTYRTARLVEDGVDPHSILLLTFTRKASEEMLKRAVGALDGRCAKVSGGTFHSFAYSVLRRYCSKIGFEHGFTILDRSDAESMISGFRKDLGPHEKGHHFPRKGTLANIFSMTVNKNSSIEDIVHEEYPHFVPVMEAIVSMNLRYQKQKIECRSMDYDDLLIYLRALLRNHPDVRKKLSSIYRFIMVDEYQDTNMIQAEIVYLLAGQTRNVMVVGDDSQSIYSFRGADFRNIMDFPKIFSGAKIVKLEENYRSTQPVLDLTNAIIEKAEEKFSKRLFTKNKKGRKPVLVNAADENCQSVFVVEKIKELNDKGKPLNSMAVLFRAGYHSFDLEIELVRVGIPFIKVGGFKFMDSAHIKDMLAHVRVLANSFDRVSWMRVLCLLKRVGPKTAGGIYEKIISSESGYKGLLELNLSSLSQLKELFSKIDVSSMKVADLGQAILNYYVQILQSKYDDHHKRLKDIKQLVTIMERYDDIETFLRDMAIEPPNVSNYDNNLAPESSNQDILRLSTVHSAKGLEWDTVFVIWTLDGRFPSIYARRNKSGLEEERRLMYVAATRAKEELFFTYPAGVYDRTLDTFLTDPSRFLDDIPENMLEEISVD